MNLAGFIPDHARIKAENLLRSVLKENIRITTGPVDYNYPLTEDFGIMLTIHNQYALNSLHYIEFIDMLLAYAGEVELRVVARSSRTLLHESFANGILKSLYPLNVLGTKGHRFLRHEDIDDSNFNTFTLANITKVIEYLCILYNEKPHIFDGER